MKKFSETKFCEYFVNELGEVFSKRKNKDVYSKLKPVQMKNGYYYVDIHGHKKVSRIVAMTLIPNPWNLREINHKNGIKSDNRLENLEWNSSRDNQLHARRTKLNGGTRHHKAKLTEDQVRKIRSEYVKRKVTYKQLSEKYGVSFFNISQIIKNKIWKYIN